MAEDYQQFTRGAWSEFSLRARPRKTERYEACKDNSCVQVEKNCLKPNNDAEISETSSIIPVPEKDSLEHDVYLIAMSYPEGRQKLLEKASRDKDAENKDKDDVVNTQDDSNLKTEEEGPNKQSSDESKGCGLPDYDSLPYGSLLWAKLGKRWFPAIKINGVMVGQQEAGHTHMWVMWFGEYKISKIRQSHAVLFGQYFKLYSKKLPCRFEKALVEALKVSVERSVCISVCIDRCGLQVEGYEGIKKWGQLESGLEYHVEKCSSQTDPFLPKKGSEFPVTILEELKKFQQPSENIKYASDKSNKLKTDKCIKFGKCKTAEVDIDIFREGFCLCCARKRTEIIGLHPLFEGSICVVCKGYLMESLLAIDKDGYYLHCAVCCNGGSLIVCDEPDCGRTFCAPCLEYYLGHDTLLEIQDTQAWKCLLCLNDAECTQYLHGKLRPRQQWKDKLVEFYNPVSKQISSEDSVSFTGRRIRVLSLFDGIGAVKVALDGLGLDIDKYYSVESDFQQQVKVYGIEPIPVEDVCHLTIEMLEDICPVDLVVANLPCEDLEVSNRKDPSFKGTGYYIFKVISVIKQIEYLCKGGNSIYWLIEGSATMKSKVRKLITDFLKVQPSMWDAQFVSAYICPRFYWGNIPGLYRSVDCYHENKNKQPVLDEYLSHVFGRQARVKMLRNIGIDIKIRKRKKKTSAQLNDLSKYDLLYWIDEDDYVPQSISSDDEGCSHMTGDQHETGHSHITDDSHMTKHSEYSAAQPSTSYHTSDYHVIRDKFHKYVDSDDEYEETLVAKKTGAKTVYTFPVLMDNKPCIIWVTETEGVLGFPEHHTDCPPFDIPHRQKFLKKTPSVYILKEILKPFADMFLTKEHE